MDVVWNTGLLAGLAATIGLLATALFRIDDKIDALGGRLDDKIDALGARLDAKIDSKIGGLDAKIDNLAARMDVRFDRVEDRLTRVELRLEQHLQTPH